MRQAILPDWWDSECAGDPAILPDIEIRVARFLGLPLANVKDPTHNFLLPVSPQAQLRRTRNTSRDRLGPAIHSAMRIAEAVVRNLCEAVPEQSVPLPGPADWRRQITATDNKVSLEAILTDLWQRGIPVIPADNLPKPSFQGIACIVEDRPVIVLGHKHKQLGRVAFFVAHEAGHLASGHCAPDMPIIDEDEEILDDADIERVADQFAIDVLMGGNEIPNVPAGDFKAMAREAAAIEQETGVEASAIIYMWAHRTGDYAAASRAAQALYQHIGARQLLHDFFERHIDLDTASESDRSLLRCVHSDPIRNESTH